MKGRTKSKQKRDSSAQMVPQAPSGVFPKWRARRNPFALPGVCPPPKKESFRRMEAISQKDLMGGRSSSGHGI